MIDDRLNASHSPCKFDHTFSSLSEGTVPLKSTESVSGSHVYNCQIYSLIFKKVFFYRFANGCIFVTLPARHFSNRFAT
jgi:hypothetical protein